MATIVGMLLSTLFAASCLWAGMKLTKVQGTFFAMLIIALISSLLGLIPVVGWVVGAVAMFILVCKWTDAEFWPDAVLMVVVARAVSVLAAMLVGALLAGT